MTIDITRHKIFRKTSKWDVYTEILFYSGALPTIIVLILKFIRQRDYLRYSIQKYTQVKIRRNQ